MVWVKDLIRAGRQANKPVCPERGGVLSGERPVAQHADWDGARGAIGAQEEEHRRIAQAGGQVEQKQIRFKLPDRISERVTEIRRRQHTDL
jgi:hypothetical protein